MSSKNKLIINCAATHVSVAEFGLSAGRLVLEKFLIQELSYDYSVQDEWLYALQSALSSLKVKGHATIIAPSMLLLTKTIKVPHVAKESQREVVSYEVGKNIPYPLDEVVWDYQVVADDGIETEIFLASMRSSEADDLCKILSSIGITVDAIDASSILDYNTWMYCGLDSDSVVVNIGAKYSNMLIAREDGMYVRSISAGGNVVTQSIADSLGQSFVGAEELKRRYMSSQAIGVAGAEHFVSGSDLLKKRICDELRRSIVNYRRQSRVNPPTKIYLTGAGSQLSGLAEALMENLQMNVEFIDPIMNLSVSRKVDQSLLADNVLRMSEVVGEAARMVYKDAMGVNLLPPNITAERAFIKKCPVFLLAAAMLVGSVVPPYLYVTKSTKQSITYTKKFEGAIAKPENNAKKFADLTKEADLLKSQIDGLEGLASTKSAWIDLFIDIEKALMEEKDVWLDTLDVVRVESKNDSAQSNKKSKTKSKANANDKKEIVGKELKISGRMLFRGEDANDNQKTQERVRSLLSKLKKIPFIIEEPKSVSTDVPKNRIGKFYFTLVVDPNKL